MCLGPGQDATGPSQPFHLLPMTCLLTLSPASHHDSPYAKGHNQVPASV